MPEYTVEVDLPSYKRGDIWPGMLFGPVVVNGVTPDEPLTRVRMNFVMGSRIFRFDSDASEYHDALITITDSTLWTATVPEVEEFLDYSGDWSWDAEFYEGTNTSPLTFYKGVLEVSGDVTRNSISVCPNPEYPTT